MGKRKHANRRSGPGSGRRSSSPGSRRQVDRRRIRPLTSGGDRLGPVVYWMHRDQRAQDNWALLFAQELALEREMPLLVSVCLAPEATEATQRQFRFMIRGLAEIERSLLAKNIPLILTTGDPAREIPQMLQRTDAGALVTDFHPLRAPRAWRARIAHDLDIPFYEVDAHNIVPCWEASDKQEWAAYTIRPKIHRALPEFLDDFPAVARHPFAWTEPVEPVDWQAVDRTMRVNRTVPEVDWITPGERAAGRALQAFIRDRLPHYHERRNDPSQDGQSNLSPYLHFGQLSAQRVALEVERYTGSIPAQEALLEELVVRRELSDNFCYYNPDYDNVAGFPEWARQTLHEHRADRRPYAYTAEQLERCETHDSLWNAAQLEMVARGKMHGYMRMYWAKKILEWSESPEEALRIAIGLNDRYELDGNDPNGYVGVAWSIGGVHDRAWKERPIYGKIRYMSAAGARRKFDVDAYVAKVLARASADSPGRDALERLGCFDTLLVARKS